MKAFVPTKLAEVIFALAIAYIGYWHIKTADSMAKGVPAFMPGPGSLWIYITGAGFLLAAVAILTDIKKTLACYLLAAMVLIFVFGIHAKAFDTNPIAALKDATIAMCALIIGNNKK
jgi:uncharacterized membrane protein